MKRLNHNSGSPWEDKVGYSRAVQIGDWVIVSGTTAVSNGEVQFPGDLYGQTKFILELIQEQLMKAGMDLQDVIRTRMYVTDIKNWEQASKAHSEFFANIKPAATMVEVNQLIDPGLLIEIEVDAYRPTQ